MQHYSGWIGHQLLKDPDIKYIKGHAISDGHVHIVELKGVTHMIQIKPVMEVKVCNAENQRRHDLVNGDYFKKWRN